MTFLDKKPDPEVEFADEIKAAEAELATKPEPVSEPEAQAPETDTIEETLGLSKPEPVAEKAPEAPAKQLEEETKVPLSALHESRRKAQELEQRYNEAVAYAQQWQAWAAAQQGQQAGEQPPDIDADPMGAMHAMQKRLQAFEQAQVEAQQQQAQFRQWQAYEANVVQATKTAVTQYKGEKTDYTDAYKFAVESRKAELRAFGVPDHEIDNQVGREEFSLAERSLRAGRNPAQVFYEFAKARGYTGPKPVDTKPAPAKAVELLAEKAAVSTSLSTGGQSPRASSEISDSELVNLRGAAFDAAFEKKFMPQRKGLFAR